MVQHCSEGSSSAVLTVLRPQGEPQTSEDPATGERAINARPHNPLNVPASPSHTPDDEFMRMCVAFDLESTGVDVIRDRIAQLACVRIASPDRCFSVHVNPLLPMSAVAAKITGLGDVFLRKQPTLETVWRDFLAFLPNPCVLVGHNASLFDDLLLAAEMQRKGLTFGELDIYTCDTLVAARKLKKKMDLRSLSLGSLCNALTGQPLEGAHDALADCRGVQLIFSHLLTETRDTQRPWSEVVRILEMRREARRKRAREPSVPQAPAGMKRHRLAKRISRPSRTQSQTGPPSSSTAAETAPPSTSTAAETASAARALHCPGNTSGEDVCCGGVVLRVKPYTA